MIRILFICHGNICRSPMAEFIMKDIVKREGCEDKFIISSAAATTEEIGSDMYPPAKAELRKHGIPFTRRQARKVRRDELDDWDYFIVMDCENMGDVAEILGTRKKVKYLLSFTGENRDVSDPWYTRDFASAYNDIYRGCMALFEAVRE